MCGLKRRPGGGAVCCLLFLLITHGNSMKACSAEEGQQCEGRRVRGESLGGSFVLESLLLVAHAPQICCIYARFLL